MSFSSNVKEELNKIIPNSRHCKLAELAGHIVYGGTVRDNEKISKLEDILKIDLSNSEAAMALKLSNESGRYKIDKILIERSCCKQAYIRGAFLESGSVTDPEKGYHLEIVTHYEDEAKLLVSILRDYDLFAKIATRRDLFVVYLKDGQEIVDCLNLMGAYISLMEMENVRILKEVNNQVNRKYNCDMANIKKTVNTGLKQCADINFIKEKKGLKWLPDNLREIALIRIEEPELSLAELGERLDPPLGKSGVNHRLRKISEIAESLRRS